MPVGLGVGEMDDLGIVIVKLHSPLIVVQLETVEDYVGKFFCVHIVPFVMPIL
jgi:hypothetical protein